MCKDGYETGGGRSYESGETSQREGVEMGGSLGAGDKGKRVGGGNEEGGGGGKVVGRRGWGKERAEGRRGRCGGKFMWGVL